MKFECGDLDRALQVSELMPEAREHLKHCAACRREYRIWNEISSTAKELHQEWDSPELWESIRTRLEAEPKPKPEKKPAPWLQPFKDWRVWAAAAALLLIALGFVFRNGTVTTPQSNDFLTEQALSEVERTEAAYRESIAKLSRLAEPELQKPPTALAVSYRDKLAMLDSAISETRANLNQNRFNVRLQTELADLYREKQETLKELLGREQKN